MRRPTARALKEHLAGKNVTQEQMIDAGLLVAGDDIPVSFDRFRDRVIFPIADFRGRIVGFGGRALAADVPAKYLNSPETELFHKGSLLYNGAEARKAAHDAGTVIAVEGYVDVDPDGRRRLRPHRRAARHGADRAPARRSSGGWPTSRSSASTATRPASAPPSAPPISRCRCSSRARASASRSCRRARTPTTSSAPPAREAMAAVIAAARPLVDMIWTRETEAGVFDTPERRAALEARLREIARGDRRRERAPPLRPGLRRAGRRLLPGAERRSERRRGRASDDGAARRRPAARHSLLRGRTRADPGLRPPPPLDAARRPRHACRSARWCW